MAKASLGWSSFSQSLLAKLQNIVFYPEGFGFKSFFWGVGFLWYWFLILIGDFMCGGVFFYVIYLLIRF